MIGFGSGRVPEGRWAQAAAEHARMRPAARGPGGAGAGRVRSQAGRVIRPENFFADREPVAPAGVGSYIVGGTVIVATTAAVLAGGWIGGAQATVLVAVVGVVEAILLGRSGIGRWAAAGLAIPLCAAAVVPTTISLLPVSVSSLGLQHTVGEYIAQAFAGLLSSGSNLFVQWAFIVGLSTIVWLCGYWLGWMAFHERQGVLAVLPALVVLAVNVLSAPSVTIGVGPGSSIGLAEILALLACILLIGLTQIDSLAAGWRRRRVSTAYLLRGRFTTAVAVTAVGVVAASLLVPPLTSTDLIGDLFNGHGPGPGPGSGPQTAYIGFSPAVVPGGPLVNQSTPVLTYSTNQGQGSYLAAVTDPIFNAGDWSPQSGVVLEPVAAGLIPRDSGGLGGTRSTLTAQISYASSHTVPTASNGQSLGLFPGDPVSVSVSGTVLGTGAAGPASPASNTSVPTITDIPSNGYYCVGDTCPPGTNPDLYAIDEIDLSRTTTSIQTGGSVSTATVAQLEAAGTDYPSWVLADAAPLVPAGGSAQDRSQATAITNLAKAWTQGLSNPYDMAEAIETRFRGTPWVYTLTPPRSPAGEWSISYFLDTSHQGYCQYFASAMGAMLRSLGIPAVLVSGYGPGTALRRYTPAGQTIYQVTSTDAHVWVEAFFPGYGWVPFEPTPPSAYGAYAPFPRGGPAASSTGAPASSSSAHTARPTPAPGLNSSPSGGTRSGIARWQIGLAGAALVVAVLALVGLRWWRRPRTLAGVWRRLAVAGTLSGVRWGEAETRGAFASRLSLALGGGGPPLLGVELGTVAAVTGKAEFSAHGLDEPDHRLWRSAWTALAPALVRLLRRRLLRRRPAL